MCGLLVPVRCQLMGRELRRTRAPAWDWLSKHTANRCGPCSRVSQQPLNWRSPPTDLDCRPGSLIHANETALSKCLLLPRCTEHCSAISAGGVCWYTASSQRWAGFTSPSQRATEGWSQPNLPGNPPGGKPRKHAALQYNTARRSMARYSFNPLERRPFPPPVLADHAARYRVRMGTSGKDQFRKRLRSRSTTSWVGGRNTNATHLSSCSGSCFAYRPSTSCRFGGLWGLLGADPEPPRRLLSLRSRSRSRSA